MDSGPAKFAALSTWANAHLAMMTGRSSGNDVWLWFGEPLPRACGAGLVPQMRAVLLLRCSVWPVHFSTLPHSVPLGPSRPSR